MLQNGKFMNNKEDSWLKLSLFGEIKVTLGVLILCLIVNISSADYGGALFNEIWFDVTPYFFGFIALFSVVAHKNGWKSFEYSKDLSLYLYSSLVGAMIGSIMLVVFQFTKSPIDYNFISFKISLFFQGLLYVVLIVLINCCIGKLIRDGVNFLSFLLILISVVFLGYILIFNRVDNEYCIAMYRDAHMICDFEERYSIVYSIYDCIRTLVDTNT
ncbi:hypothetical protein VoSk93_44030 [Vibrio owensii]